MPKDRVTTKDPSGSARQSMDFPSEQAATDDAQRSLVDMVKETLPSSLHGVSWFLTPCLADLHLPRALVGERQPF
ncbi:hypothetical protein B5U98_26890 [Bosea sp. Tri-39]|nr:hypothetical protein BLM15_29090 [Bosea sp. Tri-49]RXT16791.1 hypothetical protein B5U98_26890 [Bosea sp. Tri-39]RXT37696.1 hypothetical protein B5U99_12170 [Bosea sp. Tri-54]